LKKSKRLSLTIILVIVLAVAAWGLSVWLRIHDDPAMPPDLNGSEPFAKDPEKNIVNILILGLDQINNEPARADSIMVMSINEDTGEVALISIPRDARVEIPGRGKDKINHAMAYRGEITLMKKTVEELLGVPMHHYVYTNFKGFIIIIDILGGVQINVPRRMVYDDIYYPIDLQPGLQRLSGDKALQYVRFRSDNQGDFGRMLRQQEFVKAIAEETLKVSTLLKLPQLLEQVARHVRTDMSIPELLAFGRKASSINMDEVATVSLPGRNININGVAYVDLDQEVLQDTINRYLLWEEVEEVEEEPDAEVSAQ